MGMGYGSNFADIISSDDLKAFCPLEHFEFILALDKATDFDMFCQECEVDEPEVAEAYKALQKAFNKKTGLILGIGYHDQEGAGDKFDEVDGGFWQVDGMYEMTQAGKNIGKKVKRKFWVTFG